MPGVPTFQRRLRLCRACDVAWCAEVTPNCWICGRFAGEAQLTFTSQYSLGIAASQAERELLENGDRDWGGDPCGYTRVA